MSTARARELRANLTPSEVLGWARLKKLRAEGFHFRRQAPFKGYYLDFVCFSRRLVVEIDGGYHAQPRQAEHDAIRDRVLARQGFLTLRYDNGEVMENLDEVVRNVRVALEQRSPTRPLRGHPPHKGEGDLP